jgi:DNA primase
MIDLNRVIEQADLLAICGDTQLRKIASTNGGEWAGPCPFCGGKDRFHVQPYAKPVPIWMCRHCEDGKWHTVIGYVAMKHNLDPNIYEDLKQIVRLVTGNEPVTSPSHGPRVVFDPPPKPAYAPPPDDWQSSACQIIDECESVLWEPRSHKVLDYLRGRGLRDDTIRRFRLGYCSVGHTVKEEWLPRGITIPCIVAGEVWYLKIRLPVLPGAEKYIQWAGGRPKAIYNADALVGVSMALFCEGEFDCMIANQEIGDLITTVTMGSATNRPDLATWGGYLLPLNPILATYDSDKPGESGADGLVKLAGDRVKLAPLPEGVKDINDYYKAGGDLRAWIKSYIEFYEPAKVITPHPIINGTNGTPDPSTEPIQEPLEWAGGATLPVPEDVVYRDEEQDGYDSM